MVCHSLNCLDKNVTPQGLVKMVKINVFGFTLGVTVPFYGKYENISTAIIWVRGTENTQLLLAVCNLAGLLAHASTNSMQYGNKVNV